MFIRYKITGINPYFLHILEMFSTISPYQVNFNNKNIPHNKLFQNTGVLLMRKL